MPKPNTESSPRLTARITGVIYLLFFATTIAATLCVNKMIVSGNAAATANNILAHEPLFRFAVIMALFSTACYVALAALFYILFKPVNRSVSLIAAFLSLAGCAITAFGEFAQIVPLLFLRGSLYSSAFKVDQLQALAYMFLSVSGEATNLSLLFFAFYDFLIGYLVFRSFFLPRFLGVLMMLAGIGWFAFLAPPVADHLALYIEGLGILAEALLMLWLIVMGVNPERWKEQAAAARE